MKKVLPWWVRWACRSGTRDFCSALTPLVSPVKNIFYSPYTFLMPLSPSPSKLGGQPCWVTCLIVCFSTRRHLRTAQSPEDRDISG